MDIWIKLCSLLRKMPQMRVPEVITSGQRWSLINKNGLRSLQVPSCSSRPYADCYNSYGLHNPAVRLVHVDLARICPLLLAYGQPKNAHLSLLFTKPQ